ncbi:hypothetical protein GOP47_0010986 [Adiantum capillus-veneris]|uniref:Uncharacterized protein n=1 Tax=Adiantum capillus-veneris TaxID=13818 RepID=A0A9D4ZJC2_ADICA|nr:hypothetical protein GOP47_0010986 [Adiantum capillus-veneris]
MALRAFTRPLSRVSGPRSEPHPQTSSPCSCVASKPLLVCSPPGTPYKQPPQPAAPPRQRLCSRPCSSTSCPQADGVLQSSLPPHRVLVASRARKPMLAPFFCTPLAPLSLGGGSM